ncbi:hypothetical protein CTI12_AA184770 [Artemisia annua]|uniref:Uncharacterized protein n=1 Tax=Artemisia annua TaxID=35608 RepID=A0A2U1P7R4_ARTAN|nr:hypothetical protein CTI12_AA184770 [Artemisia annua]
MISSVIKVTKPSVATLFATSNNFAIKASPAIGTVRFQQASAGQEEPENMDKKNKENEEAQKKGDVMSDSYGEGYATRSDEEGFGGTYGSNQSFSRDDTDKVAHGNSPDYDKSQGSEVKEKEKARNQTQANC